MVAGVYAMKKSTPSSTAREVFIDTSGLKPSAKDVNFDQAGFVALLR